MKQKFIDFVNSKPADEPIDHEGCWETCAVGVFAHTIGVPAREAANKLYEEFGSCRERYTGKFLNSMYLLNIPEAVCDTIMDDLNLGKYGTYGELAIALRESE